MFDLVYINKIKMMLKVLTKTYQYRVPTASQRRHMIKNSYKTLANHELYKYNSIFNDSYDTIGEEFIDYMMEYVECFNLNITVWNYSFHHHDRLLF